MNFYLHIGYPKTASTFLQQIIFPKLKNCNVLDKDKYEIRHQILYKIITLDEVEFNDNKKKIINLLHQEVKKINKTNKIILSWPGITNPIKFHTKNTHFSNDINRTILRLNEIFSNIGEVKLILIIRNYTDLIESFFYQVRHLLKFKFKDEDLIKTLKKEDKKYENLLKAFCFSKIINLCLNNNINNSVILYEDLSNNTLNFQNSLADALDNEEIKDLNFKDLIKIRKNARDEKKKIIYKIKKSFSILSIRKIKNLFNRKFISNISYRFSLVKKIFSNKQNINIKKKNYNQLVSYYFNQDYNDLPENIKQQCKRYNYINLK